MADFIAQYAGVDTARLGLLGICGGGGYSLVAAETDKRFKSVATVSMFNSGRVRRNGYNDSQLDTIQVRLKQASAARSQEATGGEILYSGDANLMDEQIAKLPFDLYRQGYEYYWKTHASPQLDLQIHYEQFAGLDELRCYRPYRSDRSAVADGRWNQGRQLVHDSRRFQKSGQCERQRIVLD
jgi:hypothetical protein